MLLCADAPSYLPGAVSIPSGGFKKKKMTNNHDVYSIGHSEHRGLLGCEVTCFASGLPYCPTAPRLRKRWIMPRVLSL